MTSRGDGDNAVGAKAIPSLCRPRSFTVLNAVAHTELEQVLGSLLEKMTVNGSKLYTISEKNQLKLLLGLENEQIDEAVDVVRGIFRDAATFGHIDLNLLLTRGVDDNVVHIVEKAWKQAGSVVAKRLEAAQEVDVPSLVLQNTGWRLHLQMGNSKRAGHLKPTAIFQLDVIDESLISKKNERLDVELSHEELHSLFLQLNIIQAELDALPTTRTDFMS